MFLDLISTFTCAACSDHMARLAFRLHSVEGAISAAACLVLFHCDIQCLVDHESILSCVNHFNDLQNAVIIEREVSNS
uniref:Uncharacterized protein n=1 Tax=Parascaris univalens TaxID=6257 RepID=A0A915BKL4_PARUN